MCVIIDIQIINNDSFIITICVTGSSDGVVRVFTKDPARYADEAMLKVFDEEVEKMQAASQQEIGGFKLSEYV